MIQGRIVVTSMTFLGRSTISCSTTSAPYPHVKYMHNNRKARASIGRVAMSNHPSTFAHPLRLHSTYITREKREGYRFTSLAPPRKQLSFTLLVKQSVAID